MWFDLETETISAELHVRFPVFPVRHTFGAVVGSPEVFDLSVEREDDAANQTAVGREADVLDAQHVPEVYRLGNKRNRNGAVEPARLLRVEAEFWPEHLRLLHRACPGLREERARKAHAVAHSQNRVREMIDFKGKLFRIACASECSAPDQHTLSRRVRECVRMRVDLRVPSLQIGILRKARDTSEDCVARVGDVDGNGVGDRCRCRIVRHKPSKRAKFLLRQRRRRRKL